MFRPRLKCVCIFLNLSILVGNPNQAIDLRIVYQDDRLSICPDLGGSAKASGCPHPAAYGVIVHHGAVEISKRRFANRLTPLLTLDNFFLIIWIDKQHVYPMVACLPYVLDTIA